MFIEMNKKLKEKKLNPNITQLHTYLSKKMSFKKTLGLISYLTLV